MLQKKMSLRTDGLSVEFCETRVIRNNEIQKASCRRVDMHTTGNATTQVSVHSYLDGELCAGKVDTK